MKVAGVRSFGTVFNVWCEEVHHFESVLQHTSRHSLRSGSPLELGVHQLLDVHEGWEPQRRQLTILVQHVLPPL